MRGEDPVLLVRAQPRVQGQDLDLAGGEGTPVERTDRVGGVTNVALAGTEHQNVAIGAVDHQLGDGVADAVDQVAVGTLLDHRTPAHLDRVGAARHLNDRRAAEVL